MTAAALGASALRTRYKSEEKALAVIRALAYADITARGASALNTSVNDSSISTSASVGVERVHFLINNAECLFISGDIENGIITAINALKFARTLSSTASPSAAAAAASDNAKTLLLLVFDALGSTHPLVAPGRKELSKALFR